MARLSWAIREKAPRLGAEIARSTLVEHGRLVSEQMERNQPAFHGSDWQHREWLEGLGLALALSSEDCDLPQWVSEQCRGLPLSAWDAEENFPGFPRL